MATTDNAWHLSKTVPISLIIAIAIQSAGAVWFASAFVGRVEHIEVSDSKQDADLRDLKAAQQNMQVSAATLSAQLTALKDALDEVRTSQHETNDLLRQMAEGRVKP